MLQRRVLLACLAVLVAGFLPNPDVDAAQRVVFKLPDDSCVEADGGELVNGEVDVEAVNDELALASATDVLPLIDMAPEDLHELREEAAAMSGQSAVDMTQYFWAKVASGGGELVAALLGLEIVEDAYVMPGPAELPCHSAGNLSGGQTYRANAPGGVGAATVQASSGNRGAGVTIHDIEYDFNRSHEDLCDAVTNGMLPAMDLPFDGDQGPDCPPFCRTDHGTAVIGILAADEDENDTGKVGLATEATVRLFTVWPYGQPFNIPTTIIRASAGLVAGDVLLIEQQEDSACAGFGYVPVEIYSGNYNPILLATQRGIHVIEASGNGGDNLDAYFSESNCTAGIRSFANDHRTATYRDSGAVIVGACDAELPAERIYSCFGTRVDAYSRGLGVSSLGNYGGSLGNNTDYTTSFTGSSSTSAIVAGCAAILSGKHEELYNRQWGTQRLRSFLRTSGTLPQPSDLIGRQPNLVDQLDILDMGPYPGQVFTGLEPNPAVLTNPGPFGASVCGIGDVDDDGEPDILVGAPSQDTASFTDAGAVFIISGMTGQIIPDRSHFGSASNAKLGMTIAAGDVNNDGVDDYAASAPGSGVVRVFDGTDGSEMTGSGSPIGPGTATQDYGQGLAIGDLDDDGFGDIAIGSPRLNAVPPPGGGRVQVISGADGAVLQDINNTGSSDDQLGFVLAIGDVSGDGKADLIVGAPKSSSFKGRILALDNGTFYGLTINSIHGAAEGDKFGSGLAIFDMNGDGVDEVAVGAPGAGSGDGLISVFEGDSATPVRTIEGSGSATDFGEKLANAGAWDNDFTLSPFKFKEDLLVGCPSVGEVQVFTLFSDDAPQFVYEGQAGGSTLGTSVAGPGRIVLGDPAANSTRGRVYVFTAPLWQNEVP